MLKRIDYGGIVTLLLAVCWWINCDLNKYVTSQVGATLVFLSVRYNEILPVSCNLTLSLFA